MSVVEPAVGQHLYTVTASITKVVDYGVSLEALLSGQPPPPEGARLDVHVAGTAQGPRLKGTLTAIDDLHVRADGRFELHIHGETTTEDGARIALYADGVALPEPGGARAQLRENVTLRTSFPACKWVNGLQPWAQGVVNLQTGEVTVSAFTM